MECWFTEQSKFIDKVGAKKKYILDGEGLRRYGSLKEHMLTV